MVGPPGFEPGSRTSEAQSLDQASRRPLLFVYSLLLHVLDKDSRSFAGLVFENDKRGYACLDLGFIEKPS